jgi:hypothetical protein
MAKPIRVLVVNGCSMARGAELAAPHTESWPELLADELGVELVNISADGGSNRRVVRTTIEELDAIRARLHVDYQELLMFCLWTGITRTEYFDSTAEDPPPPDGWRPDLPGELHWHRIGGWRAKAGDRRARAYYRHLCSVEGASVNFFLDWLLFQTYLDSLRVASRFAFAWHSLPDELPREAEGLRSLIAPQFVFGGIPPVPADHCFCEMVAGRFPFGPWKHPLAEAHAFFATELVDWLRVDPALSFPTAG